MSPFDSILVDTAKIQDIIADLRSWMGKCEEQKLTTLHQYVATKTKQQLEPSLIFKIFCACIDILCRSSGYSSDEWQPLLTDLVSDCVNLREKDMTTLEKVHPLTTNFPAHISSHSL
jgi:hypothetical protein